MWVMHVERVHGKYTEPEIIDLDDGTGCLFRLHESDVSEDGVERLAFVLTQQAKRWAPRPPGSPLGPVIPVRWERIPHPVDPMAVGVKDGARSIIY